ncbi:MAG TPA: HAMP domain-containing sensor histidine kinase [Pyrinomonadaceae bacterium]|jgi:signal transduction histidine kinase|nr:HAMP domain-containing sensor histidine kinase [Pyrinomonadaceae bacterium]
MPLSRLLNSFRVRLLLLLALLLVLTVSVQYYVNLRAVRSNTQFIVEQQQAIMAGVALGVNSLSSGEYLDQMREEVRLPLLGDRADRVQNVLIVDEAGNIKDSLDKNQTPRENPDKSIRYVKLKDISLPPLKSAVQLPEMNTQLPEGMSVAAPGTNMDRGAFYFPIDTDKGRRYVIVVLGSASSLATTLEQQSRRSLLWTLAVLLVTTMLTAFVVWRFTRPIKFLSTGARRVAGGDFSFRVPTSGRQDEMGELTELFNDMTTKLGRTRELEAQLYNAEKAVVVSRLASAIAHEIRNPLNYINLTLDHLRAGFAPADPQKQQKFDSLTSQLKTEVARINTRITEFLNYSRPPKLEPHLLNVGDVAREALRTVQVQAAENNIETKVEEVGGSHSVTADAESIRSALTNLVINSLQAMDGEGGKISIVVSGEENGQRVRIDVLDTGRGIKPEDISKIFEPYYSTKDTGTGLGLAIVRKAVDDHHGTISVKSKEGEGTIFTITLPVSSAEV